MRLTEIRPAGRLLRPRTGPPPQAAGLTEIADFGANPGALRMFIHVPPRLPKSAPLVVILHGCGQTAAGYAEGTGWNDAADRLGFALLAPEQSTANNIGGCFNWFQPGDTARDSGEAASIRQMIARVIADHDLDARRVYVTGLSAGGAMTAALLAAYPETFAGGAVIAGLPYGAASNVPEALNAMRHVPERAPIAWADAVRRASSHKGPWPSLSVWHGDADATVDDGNAEALIEQWRVLHGLASPPSLVEQGPRYLRRSWRGNDGKTVLESYTVAGLAHGVPVHVGKEGHAGKGRDTCGRAGPYFLEAGLSSTLRIASFWGLSRAEPHIVAKKPVQPRPVSQAEAMTPDVALPASGPEHKDEGISGIIRKALKAAGLMGKS